MGFRRTLLVCLLAPSAFAAAENPALTIPRIDSPIRIDGVLDEPAWGEAAVLSLSYEIQPGENVPAPVATECLLAYDDDCLYAGFRAHDPRPAEIRAHLCDRDLAYRDDFAGIMLDPFNDERRGVEFYSNPVGAQMDLAINDLSSVDNEDDTWDAIWASAGRLTPDGYTVEISIPFTALRFPRASGVQTWGLIAMRNYPRAVRHILMSVPMDRSRMGMLCQAGKVTGMAGIRPGRSLELDPTFTGHRTDRRSGRPGLCSEGKLRGDAGLSARWGVTPNLSLNAAINPDFSQVEADVVQLAINTRFALEFPEKRPFFMEGADFFATPMQAVYTRAIFDPDWGVKFSGKQGANAYGVFAARDRQTGLIFPSNQGSSSAMLDAPATTTVARLRRDLGSRSTVGFLVTDREGDDYHNRLAGIDANLRPSGSDEIRLQALGTRTAYPRAREFGGFCGDVVALHERRSWGAWLGYEHLDPGFRADAGFIPRVDTRTARAGGELHFYGDAEDFFTRIDVDLEGSQVRDHEGVVTDRDAVLNASAQGPLQSLLETQLERLDERLEGRIYAQTKGRVHIELQPGGAAKLWFTTYGGDAIDYANRRPAVRFAWGPGGEINLGRHLRVYSDYTYDHLRVLGRRRLYTTNILDTRAVWQFSVRAYARAIFQYVTIDRTPALYERPVPPAERSLLTQILGTYKVNPQTVIYLGFTDTHSGPSAARMIGRERTVFLKIGYAWLV